jgi:hypothetical protein
MMRPNTTFLTGRKGTGKSTVFQRAQHEIRKRKHAVSAYIDIKTVYESAEVDPVLLQKVTAENGALPDSEIRRLLLYDFIREILLEVRRELQKQLDEASIIARLWQKLGTRRTELFELLDEMLLASPFRDFVDVTAFTALRATESNKTKQTNSQVQAANASGSVAGPGVVSLKVDLKGDSTYSDQSEQDSENEFSHLLLRMLNIKGVLTELHELLSSVGITRLYIFIDDFSELPEDAMTVFVDTLLAPLNNWSNELVKFKIAAYPSRIYFG